MAAKVVTLDTIKMQGLQIVIGTPNLLSMVYAVTDAANTSSTPPRALSFVALNATQQSQIDAIVATAIAQAKLAEGIP